MKLICSTLILSVTLVLAACGGGGPSEEEKTPPAALATKAAPASRAAPTAKLGIFYDMLRVIPDLPVNRHEVYINDYARLRQLTGVPLPATEVDDEALAQWIVDTYRGSLDAPLRLSPGPFVSGLDRFAERSPIRRANVGFGPQDVDQGILAGQPPTEVEAIKGRFDPEATAGAISRCATCPAPERSTYGGVAIYSWGDGLQVHLDKIFAPPAFDQLGRGRPLAVGENHVFRAFSLPAMRLMIAASQGNLPSLADVEELRLLARGLSDLGAYGAFLSDRTQGLTQTLQGLSEQGFPQQQIEQIRQSLAQSPLLRPYQAFATGVGRDDRGDYMALVLVHAGPEAASENRGLLRRRIEETSSLATNEPWTRLVDSVESRAEGRVLLAKLRGRIARAWLDWVYRQDPLILHE